MSDKNSGAKKMEQAISHYKLPPHANDSSELKMAIDQIKDRDDWMEFLPFHFSCEWDCDMWNWFKDIHTPREQG